MRTLFFIRTTTVAVLALVAALPVEAAEKKPPWRLERIWNPQTGATVTVPASTKARTFGSASIFGKVTVNTGCNTISARGILAGSAIRFGKPSSTEKACPEDLKLIEAGVMEAISLARIYERAHKNLMILRREDGQEVLALSRQQAPAP